MIPGKLPYTSQVPIVGQREVIRARKQLRPLNFRVARHPLRIVGKRRLRQSSVNSEDAEVLSPFAGGLL